MLPLSTEHLLKYFAVKRQICEWDGMWLSCLSYMASEVCASTNRITALCSEPKFSCLFYGRSGPKFLWADGGHQLGHNSYHREGGARNWCLPPFVKRKQRQFLFCDQPTLSDLCHLQNLRTRNVCDVCGTMKVLARNQDYQAAVYQSPGSWPCAASTRMGNQRL